jgi:lactoylglutathione lyase
LIKYRRENMFTFNHFNFNVLNLEKSIKFYSDTLGLKEVRRKEAPDGSWILVYLGDGNTNFTLELTWLKDRKEKYDLGEGEFHLAFETDDFNAAHEKHKKMGCICFENEKMGIYFIEDPDGYWIEIIPPKK